MTDDQSIQLHAAEFPNITWALLKRGYAKAEVKKIMGENLLRVFQTIW